MISLRFIILLSFLIFFTILSSTTALVCPKITTIQSSKQEEYLIFLKKSQLSTKSIESDHLEMLRKCLGRQIENFRPGDGIFSKSISTLNKNVITVYSAGGFFMAYSGYFDSTIAKEILARRKDVNFVEKSVRIKAHYAVNRPIILDENHLGRRATQTDAPYNLDRIDQKNFPLDGKYSFPDKAGANVNVYVVDTGISIKNTEFEKRARFGGSFCLGCPYADDHGHGTNVAGIIGGRRFGVAKNTNLIAIKVLNKDGIGNSVTVVAGLTFVLLEHLRSSNKNTIINLSLGGAFSQAINTVVGLCSNVGIHVVASAGDDSSDACNTSPASAPQAITVGATEKFTNSIASFSNVGSCVKIFAPGRDIVAAGNLLDSSTSKASGTSQACPHVAGAIALVISKKGNMKPAYMVNEILTLSVKDILINPISSKYRYMYTPNRFLNIPTP